MSMWKKIRTNAVDMFYERTSVIVIVIVIVTVVLVVRNVMTCPSLTCPNGISPLYTTSCELLASSSDSRSRFIKGDKGLVREQNDLSLSLSRNRESTFLTPPYSPLQRRRWKTFYEEIRGSG